MNKRPRSAPTVMTVSDEATVATTSSPGRSGWKAGSPSLLGAEGWRAVTPLFVRCVGFALGVMVVEGLDELAVPIRGAVGRLHLPTPDSRAAGGDGHLAMTDAFRSCTGRANRAGWTVTGA